MKTSRIADVLTRSLLLAALTCLLLPSVLSAQPEIDPDRSAPALELIMPDSTFGEMKAFRMRIDSGRFLRLPQGGEGRQAWIFATAESAPYPCSFLGIYGDDERRTLTLGRMLYEEEERAEGAVVRQVIEGTGAEEAGLRESDRIVRFDGEAVSGMMALRRKVLATEPGTEVSLTVLRGGEPLTIVATIGRRNPDRPCNLSLDAPRIELNILRERMDSLHDRITLFRSLEAPKVTMLNFPDSLLGLVDSTRTSVFGLRNRIETELMSLDSCRINGSFPGQKDSVFTRLFRRFDLTDRDRLGLSVQSIPDQLAEYFEVPQGEKGVLVTEVGKGSRAESAGFRAGDIIIEVNGKKISTPVDLIRARSDESESDTFVIIREGKIRQFQVERISASEESESLR